MNELSVEYRSGAKPVRAVDEVTFSVEAGQVLGVVGESGSGKTSIALALLRLIRPPGHIVGGDVVFEGEHLFRRPRARMHLLRGARMALIPQAAMNALDPTRRVVAQVGDVIRAHQRVNRRVARARARELLESVSLPPDSLGFPHELSGGMRQRVLIAMALANDPALLIADEPVTGLDVIVQAEILTLIAAQRRERGLAMIFISHDLPLVASLSDSLLVMQDGRVVDSGATAEVARAPAHPYSKRLLASVVTLDAQLRNENLGGGAGSPLGPATSGEPVLAVSAVSKSFRHRSRGLKPVRALRNVSLDIGAGEAVGLVGQSGSGKSTLARSVVGLIAVDGGTVSVLGSEVTAMRGRQLREVRRRMHLIFQDPYESLSPRLRVLDLVPEPMQIHGLGSRAEHADAALRALAEVGLDPDVYALRRPAELSGGERQRVALARALVLRPRLIIADEPTSMLDTALRGPLLATMQDLRRRQGIAFLFVTHDLALARYFCDRIAVMYDGQIVETGPTSDVIGAPLHPYTRALIAAVRHLQAPPGPDALDVASGCPYAPKCPNREAECLRAEPMLRELRPGHQVACFRVDASERRSLDSGGER